MDQQLANEEEVLDRQIHDAVARALWRAEVVNGLREAPEDVEERTTAFREVKSEFMPHARQIVNGLKLQKVKMYFDRSE